MNQLACSPGTRTAGRRSAALTIFAMLLAAPAAAADAADPAVIAEMEREFAAYAAEHGWVEAFRRYSAPSGQMAGPRGIATTEAALEGAPAGDRSLAWWPTFAGIARSGDFGFTTGTFSIEATRAPRGQYFTVWKRQSDGNWRWIFDGGPGSVLDPVAEGPPGAVVAALPVAERGAGSAEQAVRAVEALEAAIGSARDLVPHLAADARVYRRQRALAEGGEAAAGNALHPDPALRYHLLRTEASEGGDLAFTLGEARWQAEGVARIGAFARIWQFREGGWTIVYDQLVEQPPPAAAEPGAAGAAVACAGPGFRALDFWIGRWRVETPKGEFAGHSRVEAALGGCVLLEHWTGLFLTTGRVQKGLGVHRYDAATQRWRQAWVDDTPATADSVGRQEGERILYEEPAGAGGVRTRTTLAPLGDGRVEQRGERWDAAAGAWQTTFHLVYRREP